MSLPNSTVPPAASTSSSSCTAQQVLSYLTWLPVPCQAQGVSSPAAQQGLQLVATLFAAAITALGLTALFKPSLFTAVKEKLNLSSQGGVALAAIAATLGAGSTAWSTNNHIQIHQQNKVASAAATTPTDPTTDPTVVSAVTEQLASSPPDADLISSMLNSGNAQDGTLLSPEGSAKVLSSLIPHLPQVNSDGDPVSDPNEADPTIVTSANALLGHVQSALANSSEGNNIISNIGSNISHVFSAGKHKLGNIFHPSSSGKSGSSSASSPSTELPESNEVPPVNTLGKSKKPKDPSKSSKSKKDKTPVNNNNNNHHASVPNGASAPSGKHGSKVDKPHKAHKTPKAEGGGKNK